MDKPELTIDMLDDLYRKTKLAAGPLDGYVFRLSPAWRNEIKNLCGEQYQYMGHLFKFDINCPTGLIFLEREGADTGEGNDRR